MEPITYASAGVNIKAAESFVTRLKERSRRAGHSKLWDAAGGYAAIYPVSADTGVAVTTDGVGTKLLVAHDLKDHSTIGIDLVAMCANDLICVGATPTIFLDYLAVGKLDERQADQLISGIIEGCDRAGMILAGGETAEMPGLYEDGHYDLAGFAVGHAVRDSLITGTRISPGQKLIGVASSGIHSNGLSLARKILKPEQPVYAKLLEPTLIYVKPVVQSLASLPKRITGIAHITGGGWRNLFRLNEKVGFHIDNPLPVPEVLAEIGKHVGQEEMYKTFNMGMGLAVIADGNEKQIVNSFKEAGFTAQVIGHVTDQARTLVNSKIALTLCDN